MLIAYAVRPVPLIVCPLQFEASHLRRAFAAGDVGAFDITCCGPSQAGIQRLAQTDVAAGEVVVLAGVAGGIHNTAKAGQAFAIDRVINESGESWTPPLRLGESLVTVTSARAILHTADARCDLAQRSGAHLVDLESVAFARLASARGWRWGIVRGVSDDLATSMPEEMESWIAPDGRTRTFAVIAALLRRPALLRDVRCLRHNSRRALDSAAPIVMRLLGA